VNLAIALGLGQRHRVALVDANLRSPGVGALLGLQANGGLVDVVEERLALDQALWRFRSDQLFVMPAGATLDPHAVFASRRLGAVFDELRGRFEVVVVDGAPVLPTADMLTLGPLLDGVLVVVHAGRTPREVVKLALDAMPEVPLVGCVLHRVHAGVGAPWRLFARHDREERRLLPAARPAEAK
jgi:Mrp family chromosome partitioning ATPase